MKCRWTVVGILILAAQALAQTDSRMVLEPWHKQSWGQTTDKVLYEQQGDATDGSGTAQVFWWDSIGRFRFSKTDPDAFTLGYRLLTTNFDTHSPSLPSELNKLSLGAGMTLTQSAESKVKLVGAVGYSGDQLFSDANGLFGIAHLIYEHDLGSDRALVLTVDYDGAGPLLPDVPLPGIQYVQRGETLSYAAGFPRSFVTCRLTDALTLDAGYEFPYQADVYLDQRIAGHFSVFTNFASFFDGFQLNKHADTDRLFDQMRRVEVGVRYNNPDIWKGLSLDAAVAVGYAFDQSFFSGWDVRDLDKASGISDEPYIALIIRGTF